MRQQLALYHLDENTQRSTDAPPRFGRRASRADVRLCAGCRAKEARYGFSNESNPAAGRPSTLCFQCFRVEISRRQAVATRLARSWNATQVALPLAITLERLNRRRRRAQIAARHALGR